MTATNHLLAGALIGSVLPLPAAIPAAIASHFLMDAIPHYGLDDHKRRQVRLFRLIVFSDVALALTLAFVTIILQKWNMLICGFLAFSPDIVWVYHYFEQGRKMDRLKSTNRINNWHQNRLQREHSWGIFIELPLALVLLPIFLAQITNS